MRQLAVRSQVLFVCAILLVTFAMMMALVMQFNQRWDFTREKIYSLSEPTVRLLEEMKGGALEVLAFYPNDDPARRDFEIFLKECAIRHPDFRYRFTDLNRVPKLAGELGVREHYTVILRYDGRQERVVAPDENAFTNALLRLAHPQIFDLCFVTGHDEAALAREDRNGLRYLREALEINNYNVHEVMLGRTQQIPGPCHVMVIAGPHRDLAAEEWSVLKKAFDAGLGILLLADPMDPGTGKSFQDFAKQFGIVLGRDVIVDKMSPMVGGDFLVPLVSSYVSRHPITARFDLPTFLVVARSVQPSTEPVAGIEVSPLAFSGSGSWSESNLAALEKGEASFEKETDVAGPICLMVAAEKIPPPDSGPDTELKMPPAGGRLVVAGDSDFVTNAYLGMAGNQSLILQIFQWLVKDSRTVVITPKLPEFKPLLLKGGQRTVITGIVLGVVPLFIFAAGGLRVFWRKRTSL